MSYQVIVVNRYSCRCNRCGHSWQSDGLPSHCSWCKSRGWNTTRGVGRPRTITEVPAAKRFEGVTFETDAHGAEHSYSLRVHVAVSRDMTPVMPGVSVAQNSWRAVGAEVLETTDKCEKVLTRERMTELFGRAGVEDLDEQAEKAVQEDLATARKENCVCRE